LTPEQIRQIGLSIASAAQALTDGTFDAVKAKAQELVTALETIDVLPQGVFTDDVLHAAAEEAMGPAFDILRKTGGLPADPAPANTTGE
jgi:TRAP-type mannitol/chloroaromatic compound transport system substrate-binding protein